MSLVGSWHHPVHVVTLTAGPVLLQAVCLRASRLSTQPFCGCCSVLLSRSAGRAARVGIPIISW